MTDLTELRDAVKAASFKVEVAALRTTRPAVTSIREMLKRHEQAVRARAEAEIEARHRMTIGEHGDTGGGVNIVVGESAGPATGEAT